MKSTPPTWVRRSISVSCIVLAWSLVVVLSPALFLMAVLWDGMRKSPWVATRFLIYFSLFLSCELGGIVGALLVWAVTCGGLFSTLAFRLNFALQKWWAGSLFWGLVRVFGIKVKQRGQTDLAQAPVIVLSRHVSSADSLIPTAFISCVHDLHLRFVMKSGLLWDPCLDIVGHRLPNCFVHRGGALDEAVQQVRTLLKDLGPREGVVMFPEGTRFTALRRERTIARFRERGDEEAALMAESLGSLLPPRKPGILATLEQNPGADVLFVAHTGFETVHNLESLMSGSLVGHTLEVEFWRVPYEDIPTDEEARYRWFWEHWRRLDAWVQERESRMPTSA